MESVNYIISLLKEIWRLELVVFHGPFLIFVGINFIGYSSLFKSERKTHKRKELEKDHDANQGDAHFDRDAEATGLIVLRHWSWTSWSLSFLGWLEALQFLLRVVNWPAFRVGIKKCSNLLFSRLLVIHL